MLNVIFTLDYEIHGNGDGSSYDLMVEPTARLLDLFDEHGAKLTVMADVAEILKFREYRDRFGRDDYHYEAILAQLKDAIRRGHDVQLHLHCSYFNARYENGKWAQDWTEYNFAGLSEARISEVLGIGKNFLEEQLQAVDPGYRCYAFRAANWSVSPSRNVVRALVNNGFEIDTSVFKHGRREGLVNFDYSNAPSNIVPWKADENDICRENPESGLLEVPIYCEPRSIGAFISLNRFYRVLSSRSHRMKHHQPKQELSVKRQGPVQKAMSLLRPQAWKADFNQCTGRQLVGALRRAASKHDRDGADIPFVLIGHSKLFTRQNQRSLGSFLRFVTGAPDRFRFGTLPSYHLAASSARQAQSCAIAAA
ncbi:MAG: hypothetical protein ACJ8M1_02340 [Chthoniobacterales bacterium]